MSDDIQIQRALEQARRADTRARTCAGLVFGFHAGLRDPLPRASAPSPSRPKHVPAPRPILDEEVDDLDATPSSSTVEVLKWVAIGAAIIAPWILLLTG
jgi:hypothetical protein